jgi:putative NADH-flavin reductase
MQTPIDRLFNLSSFQRDHGLDRSWVAGFIAGARIETYRGDRNSLNVDERGKSRILREARRLRLISA